MANRASLRLAAFLVVLAIGLGLLARSFLGSEVAAGDPEAGPPIEGEPAGKSEPAAPLDRGDALVIPSPDAPAAGPATSISAGALSVERSAAATLEDLELADALW